jgi:hypothetical protein
VDVHATLCEQFSVTPKHRTHGRSLVPVLNGTGTSGRDHLLTGIYGRDLTYVDRERRFSRAPNGANRPLSLFSNRWSTMPVHALPQVRLPKPDQRAYLDTMPGSEVPVLRQPFGVNDPIPFWSTNPGLLGDQLFARLDDPNEQDNRVGDRSEREALDAMAEALRAIEAPVEQLVRLGLA